MTTTAVARRDERADLMEQVLAVGDLSKLSSSERLTYLQKVCESLGLNPLTRPLEYVNLKGKLVLYARKDCTDQLRKIHGVSIPKLEVAYEAGLVIVTAHAVDKTGRTDVDMGFAAIENLKGEDRGNAILKATTKGKRRVTLSICGLGILDETEVESIPDAVSVPTEGTRVTTIYEPTKPEQDPDLLLTLVTLLEQDPAADTKRSKPVDQMTNEEIQDGIKWLRGRALKRDQEAQAKLVADTHRTIHDASAERINALVEPEDMPTTVSQQPQQPTASADSASVGPSRDPRHTLVDRTQAWLDLAVKERDMREARKLQDEFYTALGDHASRPQSTSPEGMGVVLQANLDKLTTALRAAAGGKRA